MQTVGIDLAADPRNTAVAAVEWGSGSAVVRELVVGVDDDAVRRWLVHPDRAVGVDCPLGWPRAFVRFVGEHERGGTALAPADRADGWRRGLVLRETDRYVHDRLGLTPLSVAADRIAHPTLRLAALLAEVGVTARDGSAGVAEVYPAAALRAWGLPSRGYKGTAHAAERGALVDGLEAAAPWLDLGRFGSECRRSDDALDAVLCALVARCVALGRTEPPVDPESARVEGWIHLPALSLSELGSPS